MPKLKEDYTKQEKINGVVYNMSPSANYRHSKWKYIWKVTGGIKRQFMSCFYGES